MSISDFFGHQLRLAQNETGHRAGTDAILLAALVDTFEGGLVVDAGAASGASGLCVARRLPDAQIRLVEIDHGHITLARQNIEINNFSSRVDAVQADLLDSFENRERRGLTREDADCVITNPPYLDASTHRRPPDHDKTRAHVMPQNGLELWMKACAAMLKPKGRLHMIHRADQLTEILSSFPKNFGGIRIIPIHPHENQPATRLLVTATKNSRSPLTIASGLILHEAHGEFTAKAEALHRGKCGFSDL